MTPSFVHQLVFAQRRSAHGVMLAYLSKHAFNDDFVDSRKNILVSNLLVEVEYAETVGDKVQASEEEGLGWLKDRWNPHLNRWECGKLQ